MSDEPVFSRWSRLKRQGDTPAEEPAAPAAEAPAPVEEESDEAALERLGLPEPESLGAGDDFRAYMGEGVPTALRRRALRVLWRTNPALANLDGLVDYGEDFGRAELMPEVVATAWRIGKGFVKKAEREAEAAAEADDAAPVAEEAESGAATGAVTAAPEEVTGSEVEHGDPEAAVGEAAPEDASPDASGVKGSRRMGSHGRFQDSGSPSARPRRMKFSR